MMPNLFIIGVAKSGTTALFENLKNSKDIFFPHVKEPKYLSAQGLKFPFAGPGDHEAEKAIVKEKSTYEALFKGSKARYRADSSVDTFYYPNICIPEIKKMTNDAKIILLLRDPYERMYSAHQHLIRDGREQLSFKDAVQIEPVRISENYEFIWHYKNASLYADRIEQYQRSFPNMLVLLKDDLDSDPKAFYTKVCEYLDVEVPEISNVKFNASGVPSNSFVHTFLNSTDNPLFQKLKKSVRMVVGGRLTYLWKSRINAANLKKQEVDQTAFELVKEELNSDIQRVERLIGRDLHHWLR